MRSSSRIAARRAGRTTALWPSLGLAAATWIAFWPVTGNGFVSYDDPRYVTDNPIVQRGLTQEGIVWAFTTGNGGNWFPLTWLSHMLDCQLFGLDPAGHHASSLFLHSLAAVLLFLALEGMTGARWSSLFVAAAFALHPLRVESVAWVAERKDVLSGVFWMTTILAWSRYTRRPSTGRYVLTAVSLALGLMCKPMLVTLPLVLLLLDWWPLGRMEPPVPETPQGRGGRSGRTVSRPAMGAWDLAVEKIPLLAFSAASSVVTFLVQQKEGAVMSTDRIPIGARFGNAIVSAVAYLGKAILPVDLAVYYPYRHGLPAWQVGGAGLLLVAASALAVMLARRHRFLPTGWFWYLGTLVPVIGIVQVGSQAMADRYTYIPLVGVFILVAWGTPLLVPAPARRWVLGGGAGLLLAACAVGTALQARHWKDSVALYEKAIASTRGNFIAHYNLAKDLEAGGKVDEAVAHYLEAARINPSFDAPRNNLGVIHAARGKAEEAVRYYQEALKINPTNAEAHNNLGNALGGLGKREEAIEQFRECLRLRPTYPEAHNNLAVQLAAVGRLDEALGHYERALTLNPQFASAHNNLGSALARLGRAGEAIGHYREAIRIRPDHALARHNLADALKSQGDLRGAASEYRQALRLKPGWAPVERKLAWILATAPDPELRSATEAVALARSASRKSGDRDPEALDTLAAALAGAGQFAEAVRVARRAEELATASGRAPLRAQIRRRIALYSSNHPARESDAPATGAP